MLKWIIFSCFVLLFFIYFEIIKPFYYWSDRGVPQYKLLKIWIDFILGIIQYRNVAEKLQKVYRNFPNTRYYGVYQFLRPILVVRDPDLIKQITVKHFDHFVDHSNFIPNDGNPLWGKNIFFLNGEEWKNMRSIISPSFTSSKMKIMFSLISDCVKRCVKYFEEQGPNTIKIDVRDTSTRLSNDIIVAIVFDVICNSFKDRNNNFYSMGKKAAHFGSGIWDSIKIYFLLPFPILAKLFGISIIKPDVRSFFFGNIKDIIKNREQNNIVRPDVIHLLLQSRKTKFNSENENKPNKQLSDEDIAAQVILFFLAGFDSVATLLKFLTYELAVNVDIQTRLQCEIDQYLNEPLQYETLSKMKYLDMVISETLRKWPGAILLHRRCVKPFTIQSTKDGEKSIHLREGDVVWLPLFALHRDPEYYPEPDRFDPERFSEENKSKINPYLFIPFGTGPRVCIGNRLTIMEVKITLFYLLSKFDIVVTENTPIPIKLKPNLFQLQVEGGLCLGLKPRKSAFQVT